jgi:hypothetical protein
METPKTSALPFVAWSRVWSPLSPRAWREEAWQVLGLPGRFEDCESSFLGTFVVGLPAPRVPLLLHAALGRDGGAVREDWMRVIGHLDLRPCEPTLPPDHLGVACDVLVCAIQREEDVIVDELRKRYLEPWCAVAHERLEASAEGEEAVAQLARHFAADLSALEAMASEARASALRLADPSRVEGLDAEDVEGAGSSHGQRVPRTPAAWEADG